MGRMFQRYAEKTVQEQELPRFAETPARPARSVERRESVAARIDWLNPRMDWLKTFATGWAYGSPWVLRRARRGAGFEEGITYSGGGGNISIEPSAGGAVDGISTGVAPA